MQSSVTDTIIRVAYYTEHSSQNPMQNVSRFNQLYESVNSQQHTAREYNKKNIRILQTHAFYVPILICRFYFFKLRFVGKLVSRLPDKRFWILIVTWFLPILKQFAILNRLFIVIFSCFVAVYVATSLVNKDKYICDHRMVWYDTDVIVSMMLLTVTVK